MRVIVEIECPACKKSTIPAGASVCTGCHGHVVWGVTKEELTQAFGIGFTPGFLVFVFVVHHYWGWGIIELIASVIGGIACGLFWRKIVLNRKADTVRVFRK